MSRQAVNIVPWFKTSTVPSEMEDLLEQSFGNDGVLFGLRIQRFICGRENHFYSLNDPRRLKYFCGFIKLPEEKCIEILDFMGEMDIIDKKLWSKKIIWLNDFVEEFRTLYKNRKTKLPERPDYLLNSDNRTDNLDNIITDSDSRNDNPDFTEHKPDTRTDKLKTTDDNEILGTTNIPPITPIIRKEEEIDKMREREEENPAPGENINFSIFDKENIIKLLDENPKVPKDKIEDIAEKYILNRKKNQLHFVTKYFCNSKGVEINTPNGLEIDLQLWCLNENNFQNNSLQIKEKVNVAERVNQYIELAKRGINGNG